MIDYWELRYMYMCMYMRTVLVGSRGKEGMVYTPISRPWASVAAQWGTCNSDLCRVHSCLSSTVYLTCNDCICLSGQTNCWFYFVLEYTCMYTSINIHTYVCKVFLDVCVCIFPLTPSLLQDAVLLLRATVTKYAELRGTLKLCSCVHFLQLPFLFLCVCCIAESERQAHPPPDVPKAVQKLFNEIVTRTLSNKVGTSLGIHVYTQF